LTQGCRQSNISKVKVEEIQRRLQNGFRPFIIRTSDGKEFPVPHKEFLFVTKRSVIVADDDGFVDILDPVHISSLQEAGPLPSK
jgi:hypothetical protein